MKQMSMYKHHYAIQGKLYLSHKAKQQINRTIGCERFVYNRLVTVNTEIHQLKQYVKVIPWLQDRIDYLQETISTARAIKNSAPFLYEVDDGVVQNAMQHYRTAWKNYRAGRTKIPTLHKKQHKGSCHTNPHYFKGSAGMFDTTGFRLDGTAHVVIPKVGRVRVKFSKKIIESIFRRKAETRIGTATITMDACGEYFISIVFGSDEPFTDALPKTGKTGAFDLNLDNFLTMDDGRVIDNPRYLKKASAKLSRQQRILSRRAEQAKKDDRRLFSSKNYQKQRVRVARLNRQIARQRSDFEHVLAKDIIKTHDVVFAENLRAKNLMQNHRLAKAIADVSWRQFLTIVEQKSAMYGKTFLAIDPKNTTQTCSGCGHIMRGEEKIALGIGDWICPVCGAVHVRDYNAAKNILAAGMRSLSP